MEEPLKILIVDDDLVDRMMVCRALTRTGIPMMLREAYDGETMMQALQSGPFDCIFLDYQLPGQNGLALLQQLRCQGIHIPIIMLTGHGDEQIAVELMKAGASDYLTKTVVSPERLEHLLRNVIRLYQAEQEVALAKQQREQLLRQREDFVSRLTHDLRSPLLAAERMLHLLQENTFGPITPETQEALACMQASNQNLVQMVNTWLEVFRHEAGYKTLTFSECNLYELMQEVVGELMPLALEKKLQLKVTYPGSAQNSPSPMILADRLELRRVLVNLVGNAIKFTDSGSVCIYLSEAGPESTFITLSVEDTGCGISTEAQAALFERFRQGNHKRAGSGLGLYLSRRIVEAHGGSISAQSNFGQGSCFNISLPIYRPDATSERATSPNNLPIDR
ncbi:MAG: hybrid sensor histidine kinase/response regulator [Gloeobacterales cyanobacterium]